MTPVNGILSRPGSRILVNTNCKSVKIQNDNEHSLISNQVVADSVVANSNYANSVVARLAPPDDPPPQIPQTTIFTQRSVLHHQSISSIPNLVQNIAQQHTFTRESTVDSQGHFYENLQPYTKSKKSQRNNRQSVKTEFTIDHQLEQAIQHHASMHVNNNTVKKPNSIQTTKTAFALFTFIILLIGAGAGFGLHYLFANFVRRPQEDNFPVQNFDVESSLPNLVIPDPDAKPNTGNNPCELLECYKSPFHPDTENLQNKTINHIWKPANWLDNRFFSKQESIIKSDTNFLRWHCRIDYRNILDFKHPIPKTDCICNPGYTGLDCLNDINECALPESPCKDKQNSNCLNTFGSYACPCKNGFTGNNCEIVRKIGIIGGISAEGVEQDSGQKIRVFEPSSQQIRVSSYLPEIPEKITDFCTVSVGDVTVIFTGKNNDDNNLNVWFYDSTVALSEQFEGVLYKWQLSGNKLNTGRQGALCSMVEHKVDVRNTTSERYLVTTCGGLQNGIVIDMCESIWLDELTNPGNVVKFQIISPENYLDLPSDQFHDAVTRAHGGMITTDKNELLLFGGQTNDLMTPFSDQVWRFDILSLFRNNNNQQKGTSEVISRKPSFEKPLRNFGYSYDKGVLFLAGGESNNYRPTDSVSVYIEKSEKWQTLAHLKLPKTRLSFEILKIHDFVGMCKFSKGTLKLKEGWLVVGGITENRNGAEPIKANFDTRRVLKIESRLHLKFFERLYKALAQFNSFLTPFALIYYSTVEVFQPVCA